MASPPRNDTTNFRASATGGHRLPQEDEDDAPADTLNAENERQRRSAILQSLAEHNKWQEQRVKDMDTRLKVVDDRLSKYQSELKAVKQQNENIALTVLQQMHHLESKMQEHITRTPEAVTAVRGLARLPSPNAPDVNVLQHQIEEIVRTHFENVVQQLRKEFIEQLTKELDPVRDLVQSNFEEMEARQSNEQQATAQSLKTLQDAINANYNAQIASTVELEARLALQEPIVQKVHHRMKNLKGVKTMVNTLADSHDNLCDNLNVFFRRLAENIRDMERRITELEAELQVRRREIDI